MNEEKIKQIIESYRDTVKNVRETLELAGVPRKLTYFYIFVAPDFDDLIPEDTVKFYREVRKSVVLYLYKLGFSQREIARRLGGGALAVVAQTIKEETNGNESKNSSK